MLLLIHILFGVIATSLSIHTLKKRQAKQTSVHTSFFAILSTYAATLTSGVLLIFAGAGVLRVCISAVVFSAICLYALVYIYRNNTELRLEL
jgi:hypothetical protein